MLVIINFNKVLTGSVLSKTGSYKYISLNDLLTLT